MKDQELSSYSAEIAIETAKRIAGANYSEQLAAVLKVAISNKRNLPTFRIKGDVIPLQTYVEKWVAAYLRGYNNRPSVRIGNKSATLPDSIVKEILKMRCQSVDSNLADKIEGGHSLSMTIENIVGDLLEEYLSVRLAECGWYCCWGSTVDAVDFCKQDGTLLQIKTSDNSENSSSSRVREGTDIKKWFRRFSTKENVYNWAELNKMIGKNILSEDDFKTFVAKTIQSNPKCIYVDDSNPLVKTGH